MMRRSLTAICILAFALLVVTPAVAQADVQSRTGEAVAAGPTACICKCSIQGGYDFKWGYYEPPASGGCGSLNGQACVYKGSLGELEGCKSAPRPIPTAAANGETPVSLNQFLSWLAEMPDEE